MPTVVRLVGVYDADGGLRGELSYLVGKVQGNHCSLCDITHSPVRRRREWQAYVASLPVPFDAIHRNERDPLVRAATSGREPCVIALTDDGSIHHLLDDHDLREAGNVSGLATRIDDAVAATGLDWPSRPLTR
ncbi:MAG: hypothetical protein ACKO70_12270 [Actinomycetota bacterium]